MENPEGLPIGAVQVENGNFVWETPESKKVAKEFSQMMEARFGPGKETQAKSNPEEKDKKEINETTKGEEDKFTTTLENINLNVISFKHRFVVDKSRGNLCNCRICWLRKNKFSKCNYW